jgi:hypothetical protein
MPKMIQNSMAGPGRLPRLAALPKAMTMSAIDLNRSFFKGLQKPLALTTLGMLLALSTGNALVERVEKHAAEDRLFFGTTAGTCIRASCSPEHEALDGFRAAGRSALPSELDSNVARGAGALRKS